jgi:hypothetical protein
VRERLEWDELPAVVRAEVEDRAGPVVAAERVDTGLNCAVALIVHTTGSGSLFLKGVRTADADQMAGLLCEARMADVVGGVSPDVRYRFELEGWFLLAFLYIEGRHADLSPGTGDLPAVRRVLTNMHRLRVPTFPVPLLEERFAGVLLSSEVGCLAGTHLLHTDANPHNILIGRFGGAAFVVDWAMPALGPAWVDLAYTAVRMMESGQTSTSALLWLGDFSHWRAADPKAVDAFVNVTCRHWTRVVGEKDAEPRNARFRHLLAYRHTPAPRGTRPGSRTSR